MDSGRGDYVRGGMVEEDGLWKGELGRGDSVQVDYGRGDN